jgi:hypothetical protein
LFAAQDKRELLHFVIGKLLKHAYGTCDSYQIIALLLSRIKEEQEMPRKKQDYNTRDLIIGKKLV